MLWERDVRAKSSSVHSNIDGNTLTYMSPDNEVVCVDVKTGEQLSCVTLPEWNSEDGTVNYGSAAVSQDGKISAAVRSVGRI